MRNNILLLQRDLHANYMQWRAQWPAEIEHATRKACDKDWWDKAAHICDETGMSPALLLYAGFALRNARPEDYPARFSPTLFRSSGLIRRCATNYRDVLVAGLKSMETLQHIRNGHLELHAPRGAAELTTLVASLTLDYFKEKIHVYLHPFRKAGVTDNPRVADTVRFAHAKGNPFLLLLTAETPQMLGLASFDVAVLLRTMPWLLDVWGSFLPAGWELPGLEAKKYFVEEPHYHWPLDPWSTPYFVSERRIPTPQLFLSEGVPDALTDSFLASMRDQVRRA